MDSASFISTYDQCFLKLSYMPKLYVSSCNPYEVVCLMLDCQLILKWDSYPGQMTLSPEIVTKRLSGPFMSEEWPVFMTQGCEALMEE